MSRINDVGGLQGFPLPVSSSDEPPFHADWEAHVFGMMYGLVKQRVLVLDEVRDAIEQMPVEQYLSSSYYEKWLHAMTVLLIRKGIIDEADLHERPTGA